MSLRCASKLFLLMTCIIGLQVHLCSADLAPMNVAEITDAADVILIGRVESTLHCPASSEDIPHMHRKVSISVEKYLKNPRNSEEITVIALGATLGNTTLWVEDSPEFEEDERVLLFLREDPTFIDENPEGYYQVVGVCHGKFTIEDGVASSETGLKIEDGTNVGGVKFRLTPESPYTKYWYLAVVAFIGLAAIIVYRTRLFNRLFA